MKSLSKDLAKEFSERDPEFKKLWEDGELERAIAKQIIGVRLDLGMTQQQFADHIDVKQSFISRLENGEQNITIHTLQDIAERAGASVNINISLQEPAAT